MTREDALKVLDTIPTIGEQVDALEMAIKALEQQPCEDCISRQAVIEIIKSMTNDNPSYWNSCDVINRENTLDEIEDLPSVTPQPKTGRWIRCDILQELKCSECRRCFRNKTNFCPNCGARMEVSDAK